MDKITLRAPFDAHVHLRDGEMLNTVARFTARQFWGAIVMPNLKPSVVSASDARAYRNRIRQAPNTEGFEPFMTLYLTPNTNPDDVEEAYRSGAAIALKSYPHGGTTNSDDAARELKQVYRVLERAEKIGMPLCIHGEEVSFAGEEIDAYDREKIFVEGRLTGIRTSFPGLRIALEHISTQEAAAYVLENGGDRLGATITPQHLLYDRRDEMRDGCQPDLVCMPRLKRERHKVALRALLKLGLPFFFLGTDSAPHTESGKLRPDGCNCGCFTAPYALELYAQVFDEIGALEHFEAFASLNGPRFYGLEVPQKTITLVRGKSRHGGLVSVGQTGEKLRPLGFREDHNKSIALQWTTLPWGKTSC